MFGLVFGSDFMTGVNVIIIVIFFVIIAEFKNNFGVPIVIVIDCNIVIGDY